jgi:plasmid maintenance system antidote protein VapI
MTIDRDTLVNATDVTGGESPSLADTLESIRLDDLELSASAMAKKLGISRQHYNAIISGNTYLSVAKAAEYAHILGWPEDFFITKALQELLKRNHLDYEIELKPPRKVRA